MKEYKLTASITTKLFEGVSVESLEMIDSVHMLDVNDKVDTMKFYKNEDNCALTLALAIFDLTEEQLIELKSNPKKIFINVVFEGYQDFLSILHG